MSDLAMCRADFPALGDWAYLDSAASAHKPRAVIDAVTHCYDRDYATVHRGVYARSAAMTDAYEAARETIAAFIKARAAELVFVRGATEGINLVAQSWGRRFLSADDRIVLSQLEHHSNIVPWQILQKDIGFAIDVAPLTADGQIDVAATCDLIGPQTRLVALAHISNVLGSVLDIAPIARAARSVGARLLIDGCQAAPRLPLDMGALGADFYVFSAHKLYGPTGIGVLWAKADLLDAMPPWQGGGAMIESVSFDETRFAIPPLRFEAGTPHIAGALGMAAAVTYIEQIGMDAIMAHEAALTQRARAVLAAVPGVRLFGPDDPAGIVSFVMDGVHPHDIGTILDESGVAIRAGHHCAQPLMTHLGEVATARVSLGLYSTDADLDRLAEGMARVKRIFT